jgi:acyl carrier protein
MRTHLLSRGDAAANFYLGAGPDSVNLARLGYIADMGLDLVEIVMEAEEEFGVPIDHDRVPVVVGELYDATLAALRRHEPGQFEADPQYPEKVWEQLQALIAEQLGVDARAVTKTANFVTDLGCV